MDMNSSLKVFAFGCFAVSSQVWAVPNYIVDQNPTPGAQVTTSYDHNAGGNGITPFYGYYVTEFPSLNDYGLIAGRTDVENSPDPMVTGPSSGQAAVWQNGITKNIAFVAGGSCRDVDGDGAADASACGSRALAISNLGEAGGSSHVNLPGNDSYFEQNMAWWPSGTGEYDQGGSRRLSFYASSQSQIEDINNQSNAVGTGITNGGAGPQDGLEHGLVNVNGGQTYIGIHNQRSRAHALNESNQVTGGIVWNASDDYTSGASVTFKAYVWSWSSGEVIVAPDGITDPTYASEGFDINDSGLVVGQMGRTNSIRAFKWSSPAGNLVDIGTLGGSQSVARSVNNSGTIVGWADTSSGSPRGFIYENGVMYDLNDYASGASGFVIVDAYSINESGQILVRANNDSTNQNQYWLLTDPSSPPPSPPPPQPDVAEIVSMQSFGGTKPEEQIEMMADGAGNVISVGYYNKEAYSRGSDPAIDFDPSSDSDILDSSGEGVYIQKFDSNGNYLWTKLLPGTRMGSSTVVTDLFVEPDGSFHLTGWQTTWGYLDTDPDPNTAEVLSRSSSERNVSFRASYSPNGDFVSLARVVHSMRSVPANSVAVDDDKNIYVVYSKFGNIKSTWSDTFDFDPSSGLAEITLRRNKPAIVVTKTSRSPSGTEQLEWARALFSIGSYRKIGSSWRYDADYAFISSLSIAAPAVSDEGPMLGFMFKGGIDFQLMDSQLGFLGVPQPVDTNGVYRSGFVRMAAFDEPSFVWIDTENNASNVTLHRNGDYFAMLRIGSSASVTHGIAAEAGTNQYHRSLAGRNWGIALSQQGSVYTSGLVVGSANFDTTGYDVQGNTSNFVTKINADGSYGWTLTHPMSDGIKGYHTVTADSSGNVTAAGKLGTSSLLDQDGNAIPTYGIPDVLVTRIRPIQ